jgi:Protein of unknown function (DUF2911)
MNRFMQYLSAAAIVAVATPAVSPTLCAQAGAMRVGLSGRATTEVSLTLVDSVARAAAKPAVIKIDYGQPHLRGRALLTDSLVPVDTPWRLGANGATTLTTDVDLMIGSATVPKGSWVLLALPTRAGWKLLIQKSAVPGVAPAGPAVEHARVDLTARTLTVPMESLSIALVPSRDPGKPRGELQIVWGTHALSTTWSMK